MQHKLNCTRSGFIKTGAFEKAINMLLSTGLIILTGNAGDGKTTIAVNILRRLQTQGYTVLVLSDPGMLEQTIDPSRQIAYFVDDAFGTPTLSKRAVEIWLSLYEKLESLVSGQKMALVLATRKLVLMKAKEKGMGRYCHRYEKAIIDLTNPNFCLTDTEKRIMIANHCQGLGLFPLQLTRNLSFYSPGFPLMCKLYANNPRLRKNTTFFHNPLVVLQKDISDLLLNDQIGFCVLVLIVLYDGRLPVECLDVDEEDSVDKQKLDVVVKSYGLDESTALAKMERSVSILKGVYIEEQDDTYVFLHDSIFDAVCLTFGQKHPKEIMKIASSNFIEQRIRTESTVSTEGKDELDVIVLKKAKLKYLADRWICDIKKGVIRPIVNNPSFHDTLMAKAFIEQINKLSSSDFESIVCGVESQKSFVEYVIDESHVSIAAYLLKRVKDSHLFLEFEIPVKCFHMAIAKKNLELVKLLLDFGMKPNISTRPWKMNAVHFAAKTGNSHILQVVLEYCEAKFVYSTDSWGLLPIHYACQSSSLPCVEILVSKDSGFRCIDGDGKLPIHHAAYSGNFECVKFLHEKGCSLGGTDYAGRELLHFAAMSGNEELIFYLLRNGCNINITDEQSSTPLIYACRNGFPAAVSALVKGGANVNFCDNYGRSPLHAAAEGCHSDDSAAYACIQCLLQANADPDILDDQGKSALHYACAWSFDHRYDCVFLLLEVSSGVNTSDNFKMTPLMYACNSGSFNCATLLIMKGANPDCTGSRGNKPIHLASADGNIEIVKLLISKSVDIKATNEDGRQPIHFASQYGNDDVVCFLIWNKVNVNATDKFGKTPLHYACKWGKIKTVKLLLKLNANPLIRDNEDNFPKDLIPEWSADIEMIQTYLSNS